MIKNEFFIEITGLEEVYHILAFSSMCKNNQINNMTQVNLALNPSPNKTAMNKEQVLIEWH